MFQSQARCQPRGDGDLFGKPGGSRSSAVSISSEMPAPWRPEATTNTIEFTTGFNLKRDASPVATRWVDSSIEYDLKFQSQARCQPRGDRWQQANDGLS